MEIETANERARQINEIKLLYEDFYKTTSNLLFSDVDILVLDFIINRAKEGDTETNDEDLSKFYKFDKKIMEISLTNLSKSKIIEIKEKTVGIVGNGANAQQNQNIMKNNNRNPTIKFGRKTEKFYRLNSHVKEEFPLILEKYKKSLEKDFQYNYYCPSCKANYKTEDVFQTNLKLEPGKFVCTNPICRTYLKEMSEEGIRAGNVAMRKIKDCLEKIQNKFDLLKEKEWPFKKKLILMGNNENNDFFNNNHNAGAEENKERIELEEGNKESWAYKLFKNYYIGRFRKHFDYVAYLENGNCRKKLEMLKKMEENQKKIDKKPKKITHQIILNNRKRYLEKSDFEYDKIFKIHKNIQNP